ncbi:LptA/OstA family protein [Sphingomonas sp. MJ1 (PH-R8)]|uniref:LptA/OstA family protein n=1 Tax=unclassified Sphingomonas TaxID=196159 RepID=UPI001EF682F5|nr:LptA/OstA family protein [Sphingomonas sp. ACRSK]MCG7349466.1 LptA/OstA family protein [Sphingomonas sp. ACRSK]
MIRVPHLLLVAAPLGLLAAHAAFGQVRHDSNAPIDFSAQSIELQDRANRAILTGGVTIRQATMTLTADRVTVNYTGQVASGSPQASRLDAAGGVTVTRPDQTAKSNYAVYDVNRRVVTMIGNVSLTQGTNRLNGGRLSIDLDTGRATIDGSGVASSTAPGGGVTQQGGRVSGRFSVPKRN